MMQIRSKSGLAVVLSGLKGFERPKVRVEQYQMDGEIGAFVLWQAYMKGDIAKVSVDLGCGTGILGIGALLLGGNEVYLVDNDKSALAIAKENYVKVKSEYKIGKAHFLGKDIVEFDNNIDLVLQNPPFGVKVRHADKIFLEKAMEIGKVVYSFHKSDSKNFITKFVDEKNFKVTDVWDFKFPLKASFSFHSRRIKRILVSCFRLERKGI